METADPHVHPCAESEQDAEINSKSVRFPVQYALPVLNFSKLEPWARGTSKNKCSRDLIIVCCSAMYWSLVPVDC